MSLLSANPKKMTLTADTASERKYLPTAEQLKGKLLLADAGYTSSGYFQELSDNGGYFIIRGDKKFNPIILDAKNGEGKALPKLVGKRINDVTRRVNQDEVLDLLVESGHRRRAGKYRIIRSWFAEEKRFCIWFTNLPQEQFTSEDIRLLYRLRWQIELLFKELKSHTSWRKFNTEQKPIVDGFIWASLLALVLRRSIAMQIVPNVSHFKAAKNQDIWLLPIYKYCACEAWRYLSKHLDWVKLYLQNNAKKSQQRKSIKYKSLDGILERFIA